jgi:PAT family beta-lactamase induction signal transducer AmpG
MDLGFSLTEIGAITKLLGFWAIIAGTSIGGLIMLRLGINRSLWIFGILQAVSTAGFAVLARIGHSIPTLSVVIGFENLSAGMGTAASGFLGSITNKKFTATIRTIDQLHGIRQRRSSSPTGFCKIYGWENFYFLCLIAIRMLLPEIRALESAR